MIEKDNVQRTSKGLHLDNSYIDQPKDTYRFALNSVNETELGDFAFLSNEESNELCANLKPSFIPIGKVYSNSNEVIIFSVSEDETTSEIGILNDNCEYTEIMNDSTSSITDKLNFKVTHQIQATYRLRRGCERTLYFTDDHNKPRYFNIDKPFDFKNPDGTWSGKAFNLFKEYNLIPTFNDVEVMDSGGILEPGGYNMAIQYLDEGLNPTEWIVSSPLVKVYNDLSTEEFLNIRGSINSDVDYKMFPKTSKAIKVEFGNLDPSFSFYRIAFIESINGSGNVSGVKYTDVIPTSKDYFIYTGENAASTGTEEEILFFNDIIYKAQSIEQIENRLILGNTQGKQVNFCKLQKYASRIKADCITQKVVLNSITDPRNSKNPTMEFGDMLTGGLGYMPGEIYSFGIVYVFEDGSLSPVYHIPGKNTTIDPLTVFDPAPHTHPMSAVNESTNARYIDNDSCSNNIYWGYDSEGVPLEGRPIRHHRFPFRSAINVPLVQEESSSGPNISSYYQLKVNATGTVTLPCTQAMIDNGECTTLVSSPRFDIKVEYTVDGIAGTFSFYINPSLYVGGTGTVNENFLSNIYTSNNIVVTAIKETLDGINYTTVPSGTTSPKGMLYTTSVVPNQTSSESKLYSTEILGIKFSGVDIPDLADTNGEKIIGYYIVRNERIENEKTILDTGVLTPTLQNNKYISTGLLQPESGDTSRINKRVFGLIHPEYKFLDRQYPIYDYIKQEGNFDIIERKKSKFRYNDVQDGSSYDSSVHKGGNDDGHDAGDPDRGYDGWCLKVIVRDNITKFVQRSNFNVQASDIEDTFYLKAVESKNINQGANTVYNIASDNRAGILQTKTDIINPIQENLPYVVIGRNIADSYSNFRTLPYYRDSLNLEVNSKAILYSGDTYVTPMRYVTTTFWENRVAQRAGQTSAWSYIAGAILIVVGAVLTFFTAGASTLVIGAGIALIGAGALFISSGINKDSLVKAYGEEYAKGLRQTALDDYTSAEYGYGPQYGCCNGYDGPSDDEIQWIGDCITDLWFDSTINMSLRNGMISDVPTFIDAPGVLETGNTSPENAWEFFGLHYWSSNSRYPVSKLEYHLMNKLTAYNSSRRDNRQYLGAALGEYYEINLDYLRKNKQKIYHHLPLEYDCCTECMEDFPHRIHYSEQSFQEELTDNYRIFLPNNYKDIEGETGEIKNIFKIGNDLFIHTLEGLWQMPRSYQERVTDQISSFIGTGSYFEIPPQKIIDDDNGSSAGTQHKWSSIKTPNGYFFVCENQRKIYQFDGKQLKPISNIGLSNWFKEHTRLAINQQYYNTTGNIYTYNDNPSNLFGSGFISTYDTKKERILFTKKDFLFSPDVVDTPDYELCIQNGQVILFPNYNTIISTEEANGWNYLGLENCRMKFSKDVVKHRTEIREVTTIVNLSNKADIHVFYDTSGSFDGQGLQDIRNAVADWVANFAATNTSWTGNLYEYNNLTERWVNFLEVAIGTTYSGVDLSTKDVILVTFVNEANDSYHGGGLENPINGFTGTFQGNYNTFVSRINTTTTPSTTKLNSFIGVNYPTAFSFGGYESMSKCYVEHCLAAIQGAVYTATEAAAIPVNLGFTSGEWGTMLAALQGSNPYSTLGTPLKDYGWRIIPNRYWNGSNTVLTSQQFQDDITALLAGFTQVVVTQVETDVTYIETEYEYIDGTVVENPIELNNSWTISYSIKQGTWTSWHSYLPNFYINVPEKFYSWRYGDNNIWKHNKLADYQTYYGVYKPHIIEYVSLSTPIITRLWNHFKLITEAKIYNPDYEQYVDDRFTTFNKAILYNSRQCTGELNLKVKDIDYNQQDWFSNQTINENNNDIIIERREKDWNINDLRDIRNNYNLPIWDSKLSSVQSEYFIDKILNTSTLDVNKDWTQLESFRDKYLVIRLIFDKFAKERTTASNIKLITNYSTENEQQSFS
jgi:hypothetical protein